MVWSRWARETSDWGREVEAVLMRHGSNPAEGWRNAFTGTDLFEPVEATSMQVALEHDREGILARVASISFITALPDSTRREVQEEVATVLDAHGVASEGEVVPVPYRIELAWTRKT